MGRETTNTEVILIGSQGMGSGNQALGSLLLGNFLRQLGDDRLLPSQLVFLNTGVELLTATSPVLEHLRKLEQRQVEILACRTCVEYLGLERKIVVGKISTMEIIRRLLLDKTVLTL